jgi:hypothetical protein
MALLPPNNYLTLQQATTKINNEIFNMIGVVVDYAEPTKTIGTGEFGEMNMLVADIEENRLSITNTNTRS